MTTQGTKGIQGIRSVDFIIQATGEGVVNANGAFNVFSPAAGKFLNNHIFPKLRGMDPVQRLRAENGKDSKTMSLDDPALAEARMIVSAECIRAGLFRDVSFGLASVNHENVKSVLSSLHGLVRGYLITAQNSSFARKSPLYVTDFECGKPGLVFNQGSNSKLRGTAEEAASLHSTFKTDSNLKYVGKASLAIEDLQFIPLENSLGRSAFDYQVTVAKGHEVAASITEFLQDIAADELQPKAEFVKKAVRRGTACRVGDAGVMLNDDAIRVIASDIVQRITELYIRQGKGYLQVVETVVDYNPSARVFRASTDPTLADGVGEGPFASYYDVTDVSDEAFAAEQSRMKSERLARKGEKEDKKLTTAAKR